jgi:hypothetical protein
LKIRFQADADVDPDIWKGLLRREPSIDFRPAAGTIPDGTLDPEVLRIAADDDRVLVSGDLRTMSAHFRDFVASRESPGVLLIPSSRSIGAVIEGILFIWLNWTPEDLRNRVSWLP